jgi:hypothetical protein
MEQFDFGGSTNHIHLFGRSRNITWNRWHLNQICIILLGKNERSKKVEDKYVEKEKWYIHETAEYSLGKRHSC